MKSGFSASSILLRNLVVLRSEQYSNSDSNTSRHRLIIPLPKCISATLTHHKQNPQKNYIYQYYCKKKIKNWSSPHWKNCRRWKRPGGFWRYHRSGTGGEDLGVSWRERCRSPVVTCELRGYEEDVVLRRWRPSRAKSASIFQLVEVPSGFPAGNIDDEDDRRRRLSDYVYNEQYQVLWRKWVCEMGLWLSELPRFTFFHFHNYCKRFT